MTILNSYTINYTPNDWNGFTTMWLIIFIIGAISIVAGASLQYGKLAETLAIIGIIGSISGMGGMMVSLPGEEVTIYEYEIMFNEPVNINNINRDYEIIETRGDIFVLRERIKEGVVD